MYGASEKEIHDDNLPGDQRVNVKYDKYSIYYNSQPKEKQRTHAKLVLQCFHFLYVSLEICNIHAIAHYLVPQCRHLRDVELVSSLI